MSIAVRAEHAELLKPVPRSLAIRRVASQVVAKSLPAAFQQFALTSGGCSCDLFRRQAEGELQTNHPEELRGKYRKRGWSADKVERAVFQATKARTAPPATDFDGLRPDVRELLGDVTRRVGELCIVVHFYDGDVARERFSLSPGPVMSAEQLRAGAAPVLEDQLVTVRGAVAGEPQTSMAVGV